MLKVSRGFLTLSGLVSLLFVITSLLVIPLWSDIQVFLGTSLPVMPIALVFGLSCLGYSLYLFSKPVVKRRWVHYVALCFTGIVSIALLYVLFTELGSERVVIWRNAALYLPKALFAAAICFFVLRPPKQTAFRWVLAGVFLIIVLVWGTSPWRFRITSQPTAFLRGDHLSLIWNTNMPAANHVNFGSNQTMGDSASSQTGGLFRLSDHIQQVSIPWSFDADLYYQIDSLGVRTVFPTSAILAGRAQSEIFTMPFPSQSEKITFIAFSDLHEQTSLVEQLTDNLPWDGVDFVAYVGDLLNNTDNANQVSRSIITLPTGGQNIPRLIARGNHETRGKAARQLGDWLLDPGDQWYYTVKMGGIFFIVLDSGEDKADDHPEYSGLVDFSDYHREQAEWLQSVFEMPEYQQAEHRVVFVHIPPFDDPTDEFIPVVEMLKNQETIDLVISGHIHQSGIWYPADTGLSFPVVTCGGSAPEAMAAVKVEETSTGFDITVYGLDGTVVEQGSIP